MSFEIRALSLAEVLDTGFQLVKSRFALLGGVSLLGQVPGVAFFSLFPWMMDPFASGNPDLQEVGASFVVLVALYLLAQMSLFPFVISAVVRTVGDVYLGRELRFGDVLRAGLSRMVPLLFTYVIFVLVTAVVVIVGAGAFGAVVGISSIGLDGLGVSAGVITLLVVIFAFLTLAALLLIYFVTSLIVAAVVVLEEISLFGALARTWTLIGSAPMRAVGIAVTLYLLVAVPTFGFQLLVGVIPVVGALLSGAVQAVAYAYMFATSVVLYFDIRCRRESFDLEVLARMVEGREPTAVRPAF